MNFGAVVGGVVSHSVSAGGRKLCDLRLETRADYILSPPSFDV